MSLRALLRRFEFQGRDWRLGFMCSRSSLCALTAGVLALPQIAAAQQVGAASQASYLATQAEEGAEVYRTACAACHLPTLGGAGEAPPLAGSNFRRYWGERPASALLELVRSSMPPSAPGSLNRETVAAVVAYVMSENGIAAGSAPLSFASEGIVA